MKRLVSKKVKRKVKRNKRGPLLAPIEIGQRLREMGNRGMRKKLWWGKGRPSTTPKSLTTQRTTSWTQKRTRRPEMWRGARIVHRRRRIGTWIDPPAQTRVNLRIAMRRARASRRTPLMIGTMPPRVRTRRSILKNWIKSFSKVSRRWAIRGFRWRWIRDNKEW